MAPWSVYWDRNGLTAASPRVDAALESPYARGAASGVGVITMLAGLGELGSLIVTRWRAGETPEPADDTPGA